MPDYHLYFQDERGHFVRRRDIEMADDEGALEAARGFDHAHGIEIWCGKRKVGLVRLVSPSPSPPLASLVHE